MPQTELDRLGHPWSVEDASEGLQKTRHIIRVYKGEGVLTDEFLGVVSENICHRRAAVAYGTITVQNSDDV